MYDRNCHYLRLSPLCPDGINSHSEMRGKSSIQLFLCHCKTEKILSHYSFYIGRTVKIGEAFKIVLKHWNKIPK